MIFKRVISLSIGLFCLMAMLNAQGIDSTETTYRPIFAIKFVPLPLIHRTPAIQFAIEGRTFKNQALQLEYGYVRDLYDSWKTDFTGYKLKTEYRFYIGKGKRVAKNQFLGLQYHRKLVDVKGDGIVWRENRNYQEIREITVKNETNSFFLMGGQVFHINRSFFAELALGIGVRKLEVSLNELPPDAELSTNLQENIFDPIREPGTYTYPRVFFSIKIIYAIQ